MGRNDDEDLQTISETEVPQDAQKSQESQKPVPINGWDDFDGEENRNPPGQQCFKQKYFVNEVDSEDAVKCTMVEEESCGSYANTRFRPSQVYACARNGKNYNNDVKKMVSKSQ